MKIRTEPFIAMTAMILLMANLAFAQEAGQPSADTDRGFWKAYSGAIQEFPYEKAPRHQTIYALLEIVKHVNEIKKPELSRTLWQRAQRMIGEKGKVQYRQHLFQVALTYDDLQLATSIAEQAEGKRKLQWLDSVDLVKLKRGMKDALKKYPREPMDFWKGLEHGNALVSARKFKEADKFIQTLDIPHEENDPRGVGAMVYRKIAEHFQKEGNDKQAQLYIDKAMAIGGGLYYTGYGVKAKKMAIYGELKGKELKKMQKLGVAYGRHMRRELLARLVNELVLLEEFDKAKKTATFFEKKVEQDKELKDIAIAQAANAKKLDWNKTIDLIESKEIVSTARLSIARELFFKGLTKQAKEIADPEIKALEGQANPSKSVYLEAGKMLGATNGTAKFIELYKAHHDLSAKAMFLLAGIQGYHQKIKRKKTVQVD